MELVVANFVKETNDQQHHAFPDLLKDYQLREIPVSVKSAYKRAQLKQQ